MLKILDQILGNYLVEHFVDPIDTMVFHDEKSPFLAGLENLLRDSVKFDREVFQGDNRELHIVTDIVRNLKQCKYFKGVRKSSKEMSFRIQPSVTEVSTFKGSSYCQDNLI